MEAVAPLVCAQFMTAMPILCHVKFNKGKKSDILMVKPDFALKA